MATLAPPGSGSHLAAAMSKPGDQSNVDDIQGGQKCGGDGMDVDSCATCSSSRSSITCMLVVSLEYSGNEWTS